MNAERRRLIAREEFACARLASPSPRMADRARSLALAAVRRRLELPGEILIEQYRDHD
jgi:hypothetical protein